MILIISLFDLFFRIDVEPGNSSLEKQSHIATELLFSVIDGEEHFTDTTSLQEAQLPVLSNEQCEDYFGDIVPNVVCAFDSQVYERTVCYVSIQILLIQY